MTAWAPAAGTLGTSARFFSTVIMEPCSRNRASIGTRNKASLGSAAPRCAPGGRPGCHAARRCAQTPAPRSRRRAARSRCGTATAACAARPGRKGLVLACGGSMRKASRSARLQAQKGTSATARAADACCVRQPHSKKSTPAPPQWLAQSHSSPGQQCRWQGLGCRSDQPVPWCQWHPAPQGSRRTGRSSGRSGMGLQQSKHQASVNRVR